MDTLAISILVLNIFLGLAILFFVFRIVLSWYPQVDLTKFPLNLVAVTTEPFLAIVRRVVSPIGGVDISPVIWVGVFSLLREILLGQQGLLTMKQYLN